MKALLSFLVISMFIFGISYNLAAQEVSGNGHAAYVQKVLSTHKMADGTRMNRVHSMGVVMSETEDLNNTIQDCFGTVILDTEEKLAAAYGYCDGHDKDGDVWIIWWENAADGTGTWGYMGGTGKWANVKGGGTTKQDTQYKDRSFITWEGTWTMN